MKTIGMLGGMSWESTAIYYRLLNEETKRRLGGLHSAKIAMVSVDFDEIEKLQHADDWKTMAEMLADNARQIESAGADLLLICTNTMHKLADEVAAAIDIPLLHLADATAARIAADGVKRIALLGTRFTMEQDFYKSRIEAHGIEVTIPDHDEREDIHRIIYEELCLGNFNDAARKRYIEIMQRMIDAGDEAIIEGCTEIGILVTPEHTDIPLYDTTRIHAEQAVAAALE